MEIRYNVTGPERKRLVEAIAEIHGGTPHYLGVPTFAYEVDYFTISRDGAVSFDDRADSKEIETLVERLAERGFEPEEVPEARHGATNAQESISEGGVVSDTPGAKTRWKPPLVATAAGFAWSFPALT